MDNNNSDKDDEIPDKSVPPATAETETTTHQGDEDNQAEGGAAASAEHPAARRSRQRKRRTNRRTTKEDEELKARLRDSSNQQVNDDSRDSSSSLLEMSSDGNNIQIGDGVDRNNISSVDRPTTRVGNTSSKLPPSSSERSSDNNNMSTTTRSSSGPSVRSIYTESSSTGNSYGLEKERPDRTDRSHSAVGAVAVNQRAFGHIPAWIRNQNRDSTGSNNNTQSGNQQDQSNIPPEMRVSNNSNNDQSDIPPEMRGVGVGIMAEDQSNIPPEMRTINETTQNEEEGEAITASVRFPAIEPEPKERSKLWIYFLVGCLAIGGVVGGIVGATLGGGGSDQLAPTMPPTSLDCPGFSNTIDPRIDSMDDATLAQYNNLSENVVQKLLPDYSTPSTSEELCSSTHRALVWLASDDLATQSTETASTRFLLAYLFIEWDGEMWVDSTNWLSSSTSCNWFGITCDGNNQVIEIKLPDFHANSPINDNEIPSQIGLLTTLRSLKLNNNRFTGEIPSSLGTLTNLEILDLSTNRDLEGMFPFSSLGQLGNLRTLNIHDLAKVDCSLPPEIGKLSSLRYLNVARSLSVNGVIPSEIGDLSNLVVMNLLQFKSGGVLPSELFNLSSLEYMDLRISDFEGELSSQIGLMTSLKFFGVSDAKLDGTVPTELGRLSNLNGLVLSTNFFTGQLPSELGLLSNLNILGLSRTDMEGSIPSELLSLSNLRFLDLSESFFSGTIAVDFTKLPFLECLGLLDVGISASLSSESCNTTLDTLCMPFCQRMNLKDCSCIPEEEEAEDGEPMVFLICSKLQETEVITHNDELSYEHLELF